MPLLYLIAEVVIFFQFVGKFGFGWTFLGYFVPSLLGIFLLSRHGRETIMKVQSSIQAGQDPSREVLGTAARILGAVLLVIPGFFSRMMGFTLVFPLTRWALLAFSSVWLFKKLSKRGMAFYQFGNGAFRVYTNNRRTGPSEEPGEALRDVTDSGGDVIDVVPLKIEKRTDTDSGEQN